MIKIKKIKIKNSSSCSAVLFYRTIFDLSDRYSFWVLTLIEDILLGSSLSPLSQALMSNEAAGDISSLSGVHFSYQNYLFSFGLDDLKNEYMNEKNISEYLSSSLIKVTNENCYKELQETSLKYYKIMLKERITSKPKFLSVTKKLLPSIVNNFDDLYLHLRSYEYIQRIENEIKNNPYFLKEFVERNIIKNSEKLLIYAEGEDSNVNNWIKSNSWGS